MRSDSHRAERRRDYAAGRGVRDGQTARLLRCRPRIEFVAAAAAAAAAAEHRASGQDSAEPEILGPGGSGLPRCERSKVGCTMTHTEGCIRIPTVGCTRVHKEGCTSVHEEGHRKGEENRAIAHSFEPGWCQCISIEIGHSTRLRDGA